MTEKNHGSHTDKWWGDELGQQYAVTTDSVEHFPAILYNSNLINTVHIYIILPLIMHAYISFNIIVVRKRDLIGCK